MDQPTSEPLPPDGTDARIARAEPTRGAPAWLWILTLLLVAGVTIMQRPEADSPKEAKREAAGLGTIKAPKRDVMILLGKMMLAIRRELGANSTPPASPSAGLAGTGSPD